MKIVILLSFFLIFSCSSLPKGKKEMSKMVMEDYQSIVDQEEQVYIKELNNKKEKELKKNASRTSVTTTSRYAIMDVYPQRRPDGTVLKGAEVVIMIENDKNAILEFLE